MGCCPSKQETFRSSDITSPAQAQAETQVKVTKKNGKEENIELVFKAKRANVFTTGINENDQTNYKPKKINKSPKQAQNISKLYGDMYDLIVWCLFLAFSLL